MHHGQWKIHFIATHRQSVYWEHCLHWKPRLVCTKEHCVIIPKDRVPSPARVLEPTFNLFIESFKGLNILSDYKLSQLILEFIVPKYVWKLVLLSYYHSCFVLLSCLLSECPTGASTACCMLAKSPEEKLPGRAYCYRLIIVLQQVTNAHCWISSFML